VLVYVLVLILVLVFAFVFVLVLELLALLCECWAVEEEEEEEEEEEREKESRIYFPGVVRGAMDNGIQRSVRGVMREGGGRGERVCVNHRYSFSNPRTKCIWGVTEK